MNSNLIYDVTKIVTSEGKEVSVQYPLNADGDSVYVKDLDIPNCDNYNFSGLVEDYFNSLKTVNSNTTSSGVKTIKLWFKRTIYANAVGLGCDNTDESFGNSITLELLGSGEVVRKTIESTGDGNSRLIKFEPAAFNGINLNFNTPNAVYLSNLTIPKESQVSSRLQAAQPDGSIVNIGATPTGNLKVTDAEDGLAIAKGDVVGTTFIHKFGNATEIDTAYGFVDIWDGVDSGLGTGTINSYTFSTTDDITTLSSSNVADTQLIEIQGLDVNYDSVTQSGTLTGQTPITLDTPLVRVFRMKNIDSVDIVGEVYCYVGTAETNGVPDNTTDVRAIINNGNNQTLMAIYTIPAGFTGYMRDWYASMSKKLSASSAIKLKARPFEQVFQLKHISAISSTGSSYIQHVFTEPEVFVEKTDVLMQADASTNDIGVGAGFDIVLIRNT